MRSQIQIGFVSSLNCMFVFLSCFSRRQKKLQQSELLQRLNEETLRQGQARDGSNGTGAGRKVNK